MKAAYLKPFLVAAFIILIDQVIKTWVRTHMDFNQEIHFLGSHGMLRYTENNGMAFGWEIGGEGGKLFLTLFRIVAVDWHRLGPCVSRKTQIPPRSYHVRGADICRCTGQYYRFYFLWTPVPAWAVI